LQIVFWLASAAQENMILNNQLLTTSLSNSWLLALQHDVVLNDAILSGNSVLWKIWLAVLMIL
jgi:hypothetical protein